MGVLRTRRLGSNFERVAVAVPPPRNAVRWLARWAASETAAGSRVLNIGAGSNLSGGMKPLTARAGRLVGIDPHESIHLNTTLDEGYQMTMEEFSATEPEPFDCAVSVFVLEHVANPTEFLDATAGVLRPGCSLFALTVNKYQYFGLATWMATRLGIGDWALERLIGRERMEEYHFPTEYRLNSIGQISRALARSGFSSAEFRCFDKTDMYQWYLPEPLQGLAPRYTDVAYRVGSPHLMGNLAVRAVLR